MKSLIAFLQSRFGIFPDKIKPVESTTVKIETPVKKNSEKIGRLKIKIEFMNGDERDCVMYSCKTNSDVEYTEKHALLEQELLTISQKLENNSAYFIHQNILIPKNKFLCARHYFIPSDDYNII